MGEDNVGDSIPQFSPQVQLPHRTRERARSDELDLEHYSSGSTVGNKKECILITHIRATDVAVRLRRIPVGFYVAVKSDNVTKRTSNKPVSVGKDVVEWDDEIVLPSDPSSRTSLTVVASFELGPTLGDGEVLCKFEIAVDELLDRSGQLKFVRFLEQSDGEVVSSRTSLEIEVEQRVYGRGEYAAASDPPESEEMCQLGELTDRGHHALVRYRELQEQRDLGESVRHFEDARDLCPLDHPSRATVLFNLATAKLMHCRVNDVASDLDVPINLYRAALRLRPRGHPDHAFTLLSLGIALEARFQRGHDEADGEEGKTQLSQVLDVALADSYAYHAAVIALGTTAKSELIQPTEITQTIEDDVDDDKTVQRLDAALQWMFYPDFCSHALLDHLGILFCIQFDCLSDLADPAKAISVLEVAVQFTSDNHPDKSFWLDNLSDLLMTRYERFGDLVDLEKLISTLEKAVQFIPDGHPDKPSRMSNLGSSFLTRYERFGDVVDLEKSISMREDAVRFTPDGHSNKPSRLNNLGGSLLTRYQRSGDVVDLEKSFSKFKDAVRLTPDGHPDKPSWLNNLGNSLLTRYDRFGDVADLEKSFSMLEDAVRFTPDGHPDKPSWLNNLGDSLLTRYERFGDVVDLEKSISMLEDAVRLTPDGDPDKPASLNNLGDSLSIRYQRFGDIVDLEKSISTREDAVRFTPDGHPDKPSWLNSLGNSFLTRYQRFRDVVDLTRSISMRGDAVQLTPDGHPNKSARLNNFGHSLLTRYDRLRDRVDLENSISMREDAVRLTPDGHPDKPLRLSNLGGSLLTRYEHFGDVVDLERSISMREDAVQFTPDGHPDKLLRLISLTLSLLERFHRSSDLSSSDLPRAILYSSNAARSHTGSSLNRLQASQLWIQCLRLLRHDSQSLLEAYTVAVDLLPQLAWIGLSLHDRYHQLLQAADETCDAAAAALEAHRPERAVEWLEQGRSIMWSQLSQLRTPVDDIRTVYPELAVQFERVSHELEHTSARNTAAGDDFMDHSNMMSESLEEQARQHHALALSREKLLAEIRALPGFERFLLPKTIDQLSSLARSGPVVFLNASKHRCDALVVMADSEHVVHVPLSNTSYDEVVGMQLRLNKLLGVNSRIILRDDPDRGARIQGITPDDVFRSILPYLWDKVVSPILDVLTFSTSGPKLSRIFWCPTGPFTFLPIHAAGIYDTANSGPKLSDFVISSYIPTMSALELSLQEDSNATSRNLRLLAVPQPSTDGGVHLGGVQKEMEVIRVLSSLSPIVDLQEADGTVEDVLAKMTETDWVHFACHGTQDRTNPLDSGLLLAHCSRLKVSDIVQLSRPHGGLAFLSACQTASGDKQLSEEAIHIAAGMLLAGYRGVIATMWSIMDSDAPRVTEDVYQSLFHDGKVPDSREAAEALHHAIERLRDSGAPFLSWVPFIHVGL